VTFTAVGTWPGVAQAQNDKCASSGAWSCYAGRDPARMADDYDRLACRNDGYDEQWLMAIKPAVTLSGTSTSM